MRHLKEFFLKEFLPNGKFYELIELVKHDPTIDVELRGNRVILYYRGGKLLTINEPNDNNQGNLLERLDGKYFLPTRKGEKNPIIVPNLTLENLDAYLYKGKYAIDWYEENVSHKLGEKEIQQRVAFENNRSVNASDTDFFIADMEWEDKKFGGRTDIIAFKWGHMEHRRREVKMYMIEVKQGENSLKGSAGLAKHMADFEKFISNESAVSDVAGDMIEVLRQKYKMGLVKGLDKLFINDNLPDVEKECGFVYLLANYKLYSTALAEVLESEEMKNKNNCKFITSFFMGYGLYKDMIVSKEDVLKNYPLARRK